MVQVYTPKNGLAMSTSVAIGESWGKLEDINEADLAQRIDIQKESSESAAQTFEDSYIYNSTSVHPWNSGSSALPKRKVCGT
jgi:hypothetical protein